MKYLPERLRLNPSMLDSAALREKQGYLHTRLSGM
jgi:hypothetical protein